MVLLRKGVAKDGVFTFIGYMGLVGESEMRDHMRRKFLRDRAMEERRVRIQVCGRES